jgi:hypothetical protein
MRILDCKLGRTKHWGASPSEEAPQTPIVYFIQPKLNISALTLGKIISHWHPNPQTIIATALERVVFANNPLNIIDLNNHSSSGTIR